jgi:CheY-like chemotaxis protein
MNHILVADDDPGIRRLLERALHREGYSVQTARDGAEALRKIQKDAPDLLLLDLSMPVVSGWDVYSRLRHDGSTDVPIVVLTAEENLAGAKRALPDAEVLAKPFDINELFEAIERYCGQCSPVEAKPATQPVQQKAGANRVLILTFLFAAVGMLARIIPVRLLPRMIWRVSRFLAAWGLRGMRSSWLTASAARHIPKRAGRAAKVALFSRPAALRRGLVWR